MTTINKINVSALFTYTEPRHVSGSQAELGAGAGEITWRNAMEIASSAELDAHADAIREYAAQYGAWEQEEIDTWTPQECVALIVQEIASDLRMLGADDDLDERTLTRKYQRTDWADESEYPRGSYYVRKGELYCDFDLGV